MSRIIYFDTVYLYLYYIYVYMYSLIKRSLKRFLLSIEGVQRHSPPTVPLGMLRRFPQANVPKFPHIHNLFSQKGERGRQGGPEHNFPKFPKTSML